MPTTAINPVEHLDTHEEAAFHGIVDVLCARCGADFRRYRVPTLYRRVVNRMISAGKRTFEEYLRLLLTDADEAQRLLARVTIKVSRFYRNRDAFDSLRQHVMPELLAARAGSALKILSAGCGQGEEPYTLSMLLEDLDAPGMVDAFDIDPGALLAAAEGRYDAAALAELPFDLRERYLHPEGERFAVCDSVRRRVFFARRDVSALSVQDTEPDGYDLVCCRNVLIYFDRDAQERTLSTLCRQLRPGGYLCLGEAEWPPSAMLTVLQPLAHKTRIFRLHPGIRNARESLV